MATPDHAELDIRLDLDNRFDHHPPPNKAVGLAHEGMRERAKFLAGAVFMYVPAGREQALALTKIEEAMMWANAGIARAGNMVERKDDGSMKSKEA